MGEGGDVEVLDMDEDEGIADDTTTKASLCRSWLFFSVIRVLVIEIWYGVLWFFKVAVFISETDSIKTEP